MRSSPAQSISISDPRAAVLLVALLVCPLLCPAPLVAAEMPDTTATFTNPILPSPSQDPWVIQYGGVYLYCEARERSIHIRKARHLTELGLDSGLCVWRAPDTGPYSREVWAPELHRLGDRWYIYFAADDGRNEHHRMWVIASAGDDPYGPYSMPQRLETGGWAIDGTVLPAGDGKLYFIWSGWPGSVDGMQQLYIAAMPSPTAVDTPRVLLTTPSAPWERQAMPICEGPEILQREGTTLIVYSASGSWTWHYCLGMLVHRGGWFMDPASWEKAGPVFSPTDSVPGVGHCSFVKSPNGVEWWMLYHAKEKITDGWDDRSVRVQRVAWPEGELPDFGTPVPAGRRMAVPAE